MKRKEWDRAVSDFSSAVNLYRRRDWKGDACFNRARCNEEAGRIQEAVDDYIEAFNHGIPGAMEESLRLKGAFGQD